MRILTDINQYDLGPCVLAMGKFDGVHLGHRKLLDETVTLAKSLGAAAVALTFDRHPLSLIAPEDAPKALTDERQKRALLEELGLDALLVVPFTKELQSMQPDAFLGMIARTLHPAAIVCGTNFRFGRAAGGDEALVRRMAGQLGYRAVVVWPVEVDGQSVSSTRIRELIDAGEKQKAERMLGRPYDL